MSLPLMLIMFADRAETGESWSIGSERQLFVDGHIAGRMDGTTFELHHPTRRERVLTLNRPWEGTLGWYPIVIRDDGKYLMWYRAWGNAIAEGEKPWKSRFTCYAESEDGVHWHRPALGIHTFAGSRDNNLVFTDPQFANVCVFKDGNPAAPATERYKAVGRSSAVEPSKIFAAVSPDGVHWRRAEDPLFVERPDETFDGAPIVFWDGHEKRYMCYFRGFRPPGTTSPIRSIKVSTSRDFDQWEPLEYIDIGEPWREQFYTNAAQLYYRAPFYLLFPKRLVVGRKADPAWKQTGLSDIVLLASRDGRHFTRLFHDAFIRPGPDPRNWHERALIAGPSWVPTGPGEMSTYIVENYRTKDVHVRRMTLREDGFISVHAPFSGGEFITKPLSFEGDKLAVNFSTSAAGHIRLEIQDAAGNAIEGFSLDECPPIFGDEIDHPVPWKGGSSLGRIAGQTVRLRFTMSDADLYSFQFR